MKTAIFTAQMNIYNPVSEAVILCLQELDHLDQLGLEQWDAILIIGSSRIDEETVLNAQTISALWDYVRNGGILYAELIEAYDFPTSRLLGWKQDFSKTRRTVEKLRISQDGEMLTEGVYGGPAKGELLEGSGALALGFSIESEVLLDFGHFESIAHAAFIQAYLVTNRKEYLTAAMKGSLYMLEHWIELKFMYSRTSGLSRLLMPLSFLSMHDDTGNINRGIERLVDYLLSCQSTLGGIEETDNPDPERFGKEDAGVFIHNGEGIADQLYTNNFLLMNVWELWKVKGDARYRKLYDSLSDYMCRIQIVSEDERYNGGWMRAFDLIHGEYFGNNGDTGWGPYCMESGWTNAITSSGLLLGLLNESLFD